VNGNNNLVIADTFNNRIRQFTSPGTITTVAGNGTPGFCGDGGPATSACLNFPEAVAVDYDGNLFIADTFNNRIRKVARAALSPQWAVMVQPTSAAIVAQPSVVV
jgi:sugar lactone lactonase YvrE